MKIQQFIFSEMVIFSLYSTSNAMIREHSPELAKCNITHPQSLIMMSLWNKDGVYIKELTTQTLLDTVMLTAILRRLNTNGFLEYKLTPKDKRAKIIALTKSGKILKTQTSHIFKNMKCRIELIKENQKQPINICHKISIIFLKKRHDFFQKQKGLPFFAIRIHFNGYDATPSIFNSMNFFQVSSGCQNSKTDDLASSIEAPYTCL